MGKVARKLQLLYNNRMSSISAWITKSYRTLLRTPQITVLLAPFVLYCPLLLQRQALFWGTPLLQFVPWWTQTWHTLQLGELPLWNPLVGMGAPLLANYQTALFYPPTWIYMLAAAISGAPGIAWATTWVVTLHLALSGWGMVRLARAMGWTELAQTVAGLAWGLSGYLVTRSHFLSINATAAWLPWILLACYQLHLQPRSNTLLLKLTFFLCMQLLAGHAQTTWYTLMLAAAWIGFWAWQRSGWGALWQSGIKYFLAGIWAAGLSAVQLLPTAEYLLQSHRAEQVNYSMAATYSFWPWRLLTLFIPDLFGNPAHGDYWGYATYWEDAIYIGVLAIFLVFIAIFHKKKSDQDTRLVYFSLLLITISIIFALGKHTPVFPWLYRNIPSFNMFQAPARFLIWAEFCLALLAGLGVTYWRRPQKRALYCSRLGTMAAFGLIVGASLGWWALKSPGDHFGQINPTFVPAFALAGLWALGVGAMHLTSPTAEEAKPKQWWMWAVIIWLAADLVVAGWGLNPGTDKSDYQEYTGIYTRTNERYARYYISLNDEQRLKFETFFCFDTFDVPGGVMAVRDTLLPNTNILDGLDSTSNFDPIVTGRYYQWMNLLQQQPQAIQQQLLGRMGVDVLLKVNDTLPSVVTPVPLSIHYGRVHWAGCALVVEDGDKALQALLSGQVPGNTVVIEGGGPASCVPGSQAAFLQLSTPNSVSLSVSTQQGGYLVLADSWYPGWLATIDGEPVEVLRADYLFRAVYVPAGVHQLDFRYHPLSLYIGLAISAFSWLAVALLLWRMHARAK